MEEQGCRDVVGQVADDAQSSSAADCQRCEVEAQGVIFVQREPPRAPLLAQLGRKVTIDLDGIESSETIEQRCRQCAVPRSDLDEYVFGRRIERLENLPDDPRIVQEVLTETFASEDHDPSARGRLRGRCTSPSIDEFECKVDGCSKTAHIGLPGTGEGQCRAVIDRGTYER